MKPLRFIRSTGLLLLFISSCKTPDTSLSVTERKMPASFNETPADTTNISNISWKEYFADEHLNSLIDTALVNNYDLQIAMQRVVTVRSELIKAKGKLLPTIDMAIRGGQERVGEYSVDWVGNEGETFLSGDPLNPAFNDYFLGLESTWEIDVWGKLKNKRKAALSDYLSSIEGKNNVRSNLLAGIAILYYELLALDNELETLGQTITMQQKALEVVQLQKEVGRANELAVQQFQAQVLHTQTLEKETHKQIVATENRINFLLGRYPQPIKRSKEQLFKEIPPQIALGVPSQLLLNRPDVRASEFRVQASKFNLESAKAAFYPSVNINANIGFKAFNPNYLFLTPESVAYSAIGGLVAPLINRKALKAEFQTAKAHQLSALYNYQKTILNAYVEVANEVSNLQQLQDIVSLKNRENKVLENAIEASEEFYRLAKANYLEVLIAQQNSLQTKLELIEVHKRQQIATVNIYKALGGGW